MTALLGDRSIDLLWDNIGHISITIHVILFSIASYIILYMSLYIIISNIHRLQNKYSLIPVFKIALLTIFCISIINWTSTAVKSSIRFYLPICSNEILIFPYLILLCVILKSFAGVLKKINILQRGISVIALLIISFYIMVLYFLISISVSAAGYQIDRLFNHSHSMIDDFTKKSCFAITKRKPEYSWVVSGSDEYLRKEEQNRNDSIDHEIIER